MNIVNIKAYLCVALVIFVITFLKFLYSDRKEIYLDIFISDLAESLIISLSWIISVPIIALAHLFLIIADIIIYIRTGE